MDAFSGGDLLGGISGVGGFVVLFLQYLKQFKWIRNGWLPVIAPLVGVVVVIVGLVAAGKLKLTAGGLEFDPIALYNGVLDGFGAGIAAPLGYRLQKPLGILPPGPDNHPKDAGTTPTATTTSNDMPANGLQRVLANSPVAAAGVVVQDVETGASSPETSFTPETARSQDSAPVANGAVEGVQTAGLPTRGNAGQPANLDSANEVGLSQFIAPAPAFAVADERGEG